MPGRRSYRKAVGELSERQKLRKERDEYYRTIRCWKGRVPGMSEDISSRGSPKFDTDTAADKLVTAPLRTVITTENDALEEASKEDHLNAITRCLEPRSVRIPQVIEPQLVPISQSLQEFASRYGWKGTSPATVSTSNLSSSLSSDACRLSSSRSMHLPAEKTMEDIGLSLRQAIREVPEVKTSRHSEGSASTCTGSRSSSRSESDDVVPKKTMTAMRDHGVHSRRQI